MFVYRVECPDTGRGIFNKGLAWEYDRHRRCKSSAGGMPDPCNKMHEEGTPLFEFFARSPYEKTREYFFGFKDIEQLKKWFSSKVGRRSVADKLHIGVYKVSKKYVKEGNYQLVFKKDKAKLKYSLCFETFQKRGK